ncbi:MAG: sigma-54 dependent transcriptional regulator [Treponema sp.]|jgi:two-component system response regulator AtoC|nr:sigma-54 dependent transcriptional regulator [Treponema sp.]
MRVLIVDDEHNIRSSLQKYLGLENIRSEGAESGGAAMDWLSREHFDAVILDLKLPDKSGHEVLEWIQSRGISSPVIMISAHGEIADAVESLKNGAKDYLVKPFDPAELIIRLRALVENRRREYVLEAARRTEGQGRGENLLLGNSPGILRIGQQIDKIAGSDVTVLITGESGSGKEVAAREIHRRGPHSGEPFAAVNIGGIHEGLMESELFGHEKGAFTGAANRRLGLFELAGRGCLFLDEIGEMPMPLQVKLLRVLQERKIRRLGGVSDIPVNARIISATNRDLEALVREGRFREDLYYRLNVFRVNVPPLRERREDIPLLARHFLDRKSPKSSPALSPEAREKLLNYPFPGNIRELENILERALIYCEDGLIREGDIDLHEGASAALKSQAAGGPEAAGSAPEGLPPIHGAPDGAPVSLDEMEKQAIAGALAKTGGNRTRAAEMLGVSRKTILNKIKLFGLE